MESQSDSQDPSSDSHSVPSYSWPSYSVPSYPVIVGSASASDSSESESQSDSESQSESKSDSQSRPKASHRAVIVRRVSRVANDQVTAKSYSVPWSTSHSTSGSASHRSDSGRDRQADLKVIPRHQPAIREIHLPVTQMIRQQVIPRSIHERIRSPKRKPFR